MLCTLRGWHQLAGETQMPPRPTFVPAAVRVARVIAQKV